MNTEKTIKGNLGEWSELLTLAQLLLHGGGYSADSEQKKIEANFNKVLEVVFTENQTEPETIFKIEGERIDVFQNEVMLKSVSKSELENATKTFFDELKNGTNSRTFSLESGSALMNLLARKTISAKSNETITDLELVIQDPITGGPQPRSGYSIKSQLGGAATLLNSSGSTNIIYKIESKEVDREPVLPGTSNRKNIQSLYEQGFELIFDSYQRDTFRTNLSFVDSQLPINLPKVVLTHYLVNDTSEYAATVEKVFPPGTQENEQIIYKFKQLLLAVSMGLRPATAWKGNLEKYKGLLILNQKGEVLFYPQETKLNFQDFLYRSVKFERPDSRLKYGLIYKLNGKFFIKLNFQIRFK